MNIINNQSGNNQAKWITICLAFLTILLMACAADESPPAPTKGDQPSVNVADTATSAKSGNAEFNISGAHQINEPAAIASATAMPGSDAFIIQIKTSITGERAPAIIFLENLPAAIGDYDLSDLSIDDPQPDVHEAGVDIKDNNTSGVYPYNQFGESVNGTLTITSVESNKMTANFEFSAQKDGESVTVTGAFENVNLP